MIPLSCLNCCHNPLQLGPVGTAFGFCTRHRVVLNQPTATTCGQLLRKDLLVDSARAEQERHRKIFPETDVVLLRSPKTRAKDVGLVEEPNGQLPPDAVVEEVTSYGVIDRKIGTMRALRRVPGIRAEIAMLSLSRSYFSNCVRLGGPWTAGVHLAFWTLDRLDAEPQLEAADIRGPVGPSLGRTIAVAKWLVIALRMSFLADVGSRAKRARDPAAVFVKLIQKAVVGSSVEEPAKLLASLKKHRKAWRAGLTSDRYAELREKLHEEAAE